MSLPLKASSPRRRVVAAVDDDVVVGDDVQSTASIERDGVADDADR